MDVPKVVLPFACLPNVEYLSWMLHSPEISIEIQETYPKQTCRNRYAIMAASGPTVLTIPVKRPAGNHTKFTEVMLDAPAKWVNLHWRAIESAYNKSPFFLYYRDDFERIYRNPPDSLFELNQQFLELAIKLCAIKMEYRYTEQFENSYSSGTADMRHLIMPKQALAHNFIMKFEPYIQVFAEMQPFAPNLSVLDLLFNLGPEAGTYLTKHSPGMV